MMPEEIYDEEESEDDSPSHGKSAQDVPTQPQQQQQGEDNTNDIEESSERAASSLTGSTEKSNDDIDEKSDADEEEKSSNGTSDHVGEEDDDNDFVEVSPAASSSPASGPHHSEKSKDIANTMRLPGGNNSGDLLENVAKRLLGHPDHRQQQQLETKTPQRGNDFLRQVKRDFADASGDIATSASALKASIQSSLQASPRAALKKEGHERYADSGDGGTQKEHAETEPANTTSPSITSSTRFGAPALPSLPRVVRPRANRLNLLLPRCQQVVLRQRHKCQPLLVPPQSPSLPLPALSNQLSRYLNPPSMRIRFTSTHTNNPRTAVYATVC